MLFPFYILHPVWPYFLPNNSPLLLLNLVLYHGDFLFPSRVIPSGGKVEEWLVTHKWFILQCV